MPRLEPVMSTIFRVVPYAMLLSSFPLISDEARVTRRLFCLSCIQQISGQSTPQLGNRCLWSGTIYTYVAA